MVEVDRLSKTYTLYDRPADRLLESLPFRPSVRSKAFSALTDVSFRVDPGETFALVGPNGSGKSTLLQLIAGIFPPTSGTVRCEGRVAALLELGSGFSPEFTGRENVLLHGELHGLSRSEVERKFPHIRDFAAIGDFMDRPVKEYSTGMYLRLAFSAAIHVSPDVLIVDEALAVGDVRFANRCIRKLEELKRQGVTILFVSHDLGMVKRLADRAALLIGGRLETVGLPNEVVNRYVGIALAGEVSDETPGESGIRHGDGASRIDSVRLMGEDGRERSIFESGDLIVVELKATFVRDCAAPMAGLLIRNRLGIDVYGTNTKIEGLQTGIAAAGTQAAIRFAFECRLTRQDYSVTLAMQNPDGTSQDWRDDVVDFRVILKKDIAGVADLQAKVEWHTH